MVKNKRKISKKRKKSAHKSSAERKKEEMERAQVWSVDVLLAVVIFVAVILIFYTTMNRNRTTELQDLEAEAGNLKLELEQNYLFGFLIDDEIDEAKFQAFIENVTYNYTALKEKLGIKGEFCIFFEDSEGNVIVFNSSVGNHTAIGGGGVFIGNIECNGTLP